MIDSFISTKSNNNLGKQIYDKINATGGIKNPVANNTNIVNDNIGRVGNSIDRKISELTNSITPNQTAIEKLNKAKSMLSTAKSTMGSFSSHTDETMSNYYQVMSAAKSFSGRIGGEDGCQAYTGVLGSISGVGNMILNRLNDAIALLESCLSTVDNIISMVDGIISRINNISNEIKNLIAREVANLARYMEELWKLSFSSALAYLFDDECLSGIISESLDSEVIDMIK